MNHKNNKATASPVDRTVKATVLRTIVNKPWFPIAVLFLCAFVYFVPSPGFGKIIMGTDDGPRGWFEKGNIGYAIESWSDKWAPLNGGTAMMERRFGRFINPAQLFHLVLPKYQARVLEYILWTFVAGAFMFMFLRTITVSRNAATVTALGFMFAPGFQSYIFAGHFARMEVVALLPGIMLFTERMLKRFFPLDAIALAAIISLAVYSEHLQLAYFAFLGMGAYYAARMLWQVFRTRETSLPDGSKRTGLFATAVLFGALLTSMNIFPSMHDTDTTSKRAGGVDYAYASSFAAHPEEIVSLVEPDFVGWKEYYWGQNALKLNSEYFGIVFLLGAILTFLLVRPDFRKILLAIFFFMSMAFALGPHTPIHALAYNFLPGMKSFRAPGMMYIWFYFAALVLAAQSFDELGKVDWNDASLRRRLLIFAGVSGGVLLVFMFFAGPLAQWWYNTFYPLELRSERKEQSLIANLKNLKSGAVLIFLAGGAFLTFAYLRIRGKVSDRVFYVALIAILALDLLRVSRPFLSQAVKPKNVFTMQEQWEKSIGDFLNKRDPGRYRVHTMLGDMKQYIPGLDLTYIFDDFINKRYDDIVEVVMNAGRMVSKDGQRSPMAENVFVNGLRLLNAKYVLTTTELALPGLSRYFAQGPLRIYRTDQVLPMVRLASAAQMARDPDQAVLGALSTGTFDPATVIVPEGTALNGVASRPDTVDTLSTASLTVDEWSIRSGQVRITTQCTRPQVLVFSQNYDRQWRATVNGSAVPVFPADYLWNAAVVPAGKSTVEFVYNSTVASKWRRVTLLAFIVYVLAALALTGQFALSRRTGGMNTSK